MFGQTRVIVLVSVIAPFGLTLEKLIWVNGSRGPLSYGCGDAGGISTAQNRFEIRIAGLGSAKGRAHYVT